jgi:hypothetical protein
MRVLHFLLFLGIFFSEPGLPISCPETLGQLVLFFPNEVPAIYDRLQVKNEKGKTQLALQSDFDGKIRDGGGGACASATAFNFLQGFRLMINRKPLNPNTVLNGSFRQIPELLDGRVTNTQMTQLLHHFEKFLPGYQIEVSAVRSPQSQPAAGEQTGTVVQSFSPKSFEVQPNEMKMVIYQVHDKDGKLLGRHFVVLKRQGEGNQIVVIDPNVPHKEFKYQLSELSDPQKGDQVLTRLSRPDGVPHGSGWIFTLDTLFSAKLKPLTSAN